MKKGIFNKYATILLIFIIGSFIGFLHENILELVQGYNRLKQGLIYEPLIPVYGIGALVYYYIYKDIPKKHNKLLNILIVFFIGFILGGCVEYFLSYMQEKIFGTVSWNYVYLKFNLNGRTSLFHACFWGITGVLFYYLFLPQLKKLEAYIEKNNHYILIIVLSGILLFDCTISTVACLRHAQRREGLIPQNSIEEFLDRHYPDEYLNRIYPTARIPKR